MSVKTLNKDVVDGQNQSMEVLAKRSNISVRFPWSPVSGGRGNNKAGGSELMCSQLNCGRFFLLGEAFLFEKQNYLVISRCHIPLKKWKILKIDNMDDIVGVYNTTFHV